MRGRITVLFDLVAACRENIAIHDDHAADRSARRIVTLLSSHPDRRADKILS
jgi:hypothetical protein